MYSGIKQKQPKHLFAPSPCGGGTGWGLVILLMNQSLFFTLAAPTPTLPHRGGGISAACLASVHYTGSGFGLFRVYSTINRGGCYSSTKTQTPLSREGLFLWFSGLGLYQQPRPLHAHPVGQDADGEHAKDEPQRVHALAQEIHAEEGEAKRGQGGQKAVECAL